MFFDRGIMDLKEAAETMGFNVILPNVLTRYLGVSFTDAELLQLNTVPVKKNELLAPDPYESKNSIKDTYALYPVAAKADFLGKTWPLNVYYLFKRFGFAHDPENPNSISFFRRDEHLNINKGWIRWFENREGEPPLNHPIYKVCRAVGWRLMRKHPPASTFGKNFSACLNLLRNNDQPATLLEILLMIISYYFWMADSQKTDESIGQPRWESRDVFARLLYAKISWTADCYYSGEKLTVGLQDKEGGIFIYPVNPEKTSLITGILPVRRLN